MHKQIFLMVGMLLILFVSIFTSDNNTLAHPGRTDSYGGHYVRTEGWGYSVNYTGEIPAAFKTSKKSTSIVKKYYAKVPNYPIMINSNQIDYTHSKYPFLSYKNITYVPLTYDLCNSLGVKISWDNTNGLMIAKGTYQTCQQSIMVTILPDPI